MKIYTETDLRTAFEAGRQQIWEDLEQTTLCPKFDSFEEWFEQYKLKKS